MTPTEIRAVVNELNATAKKALGKNAAELVVRQHGAYAVVYCHSLSLFDNAMESATTPDELRERICESIHGYVDQLMAFDPERWEGCFDCEEED